MPFHFSLSSLLRLRESLEKIELRRLQTVAAQVAQVHSEIEWLDLETEAARRRIIEQASAGISGAELHIAALAESARRERRAALLIKREELVRAREQQQARYNHARQQSEILSNLRQHQFSTYLREQARREQQQIDELFVIRGPNRKRSNQFPEEDATR